MFILKGSIIAGLIPRLRIRAELQKLAFKNKNNPNFELEFEEIQMPLKSEFLIYARGSQEFMDAFKQNFGDRLKIGAFVNEEA